MPGRRASGTVASATVDAMRRSFWAWGWEEMLPAGAAREALAAQVAGALNPAGILNPGVLFD